MYLFIQMFNYISNFNIFLLVIYKLVETRSRPLRHRSIQVKPEDGSQKPKHAAESCKFMKYLIKSCVRLYYIILFNRKIMVT
jgi:hypothetical protein